MDPSTDAGVPSAGYFSATFWLTRSSTSPGLRADDSPAVENHDGEVTRALGRFRRRDAKGRRELALALYEEVEEQNH